MVIFPDGSFHSESKHLWAPGWYLNWRCAQYERKDKFGNTLELITMQMVAEWMKHGQRGPIKIGEITG